MDHAILHMGLPESNRAGIVDLAGARFGNVGRPQLISGRIPVLRGIITKTGFYTPWKKISDMKALVNYT